MNDLAWAQRQLVLETRRRKRAELGSDMPIASAAMSRGRTSATVRVPGPERWRISSGPGTRTSGSRDPEVRQYADLLAVIAKAVVTELRAAKYLEIHLPTEETTK